jgi:hypothetical protein
VSLSPERSPAQSALSNQQSLEKTTSDVYDGEQG